MPPQPLTNFEIQRYFQNEPKFKVYSWNYLPKTKPGEYRSIGSHWIALYVNGNNVTYLGSFQVEQIPKEIKKFIDSKNITPNIYRI